MNSLTGKVSVWKACLGFLIFASLLCVSFVPASTVSTVYASQTAADCDGDGIPDELDPDDDNDGVSDVLDPASCDPTVTGNAGSGGNSSTNDADGDGIPDDLDPDDGSNDTSGNGSGTTPPSNNAPVVSALPSTGSGDSLSTVLPLVSLAIFAVGRYRRK